MVIQNLLKLSKVKAMAVNDTTQGRPKSCKEIIEWCCKVFEELSKDIRYKHRVMQREIEKQGLGDEDEVIWKELKDEDTLRVNNNEDRIPEHDRDDGFVRARSKTRRTADRSRGGEMTDRRARKRMARITFDTCDDCGDTLDHYPWQCKARDLVCLNCRMIGHVFWRCKM